MLVSRFLVMPAVRHEIPNEAAMLYKKTSMGWGEAQNGVHGVCVWHVCAPRTHTIDSAMVVVLIIVATTTTTVTALSTAEEAHTETKMLTQKPETPRTPNIAPPAHAAIRT